MDPKLFERHGIEMQGELWAMMLDAKATFDEVVRKHAPDAETRDRILDNRIYQQLSAALAGSQEYMAMEKLFGLHSEGRFDLLVLDTPPTRNALDFLDAPRRLTQFIEGRSLRVFMRPTGIAARVAGRGASAALSILRRILGFDLLADLSEFFTAFGGMVDGFQERAKRVNELLADPRTCFLVVCGPQGEASAVLLRAGALPAQYRRGEIGIGIAQAVLDREKEAREGGRNRLRPRLQLPEVACGHEHVEVEGPVASGVVAHVAPVDERPRQRLLQPRRPEAGGEGGHVATGRGQQLLQQRGVAGEPVVAHAPAGPLGRVRAHGQHVAGRQARFLCASDVEPGRVMTHLHAPADVAPAHAQGIQPEYLSDLSHGQPFRRHLFLFGEFAGPRRKQTAFRDGRPVPHSPGFRVVSFVRNSRSDSTETGGQLAPKQPVRILRNPQDSVLAALWQDTYTDINKCMRFATRYQRPFSSPRPRGPLPLDR